jgi:hypothetical protein
MAYRVKLEIDGQTSYLKSITNQIFLDDPKFAKKFKNSELAEIAIEKSKWQYQRYCIVEEVEV